MESGEARAGREETSGAAAAAAFAAAPGHSPSLGGMSAAKPEVGARAPAAPEPGAPVRGAPGADLDGKHSAELKPVIGNVDRFSFRKAPVAAAEPRVTSMKIPGYELLTNMDKPSGVLSPDGSRSVSSVDAPAVGGSRSAPGHGGVALPVEGIEASPKEPEPVVVPPEPDAAAQAVQAGADAAPPSPLPVEPPTVAEPAVVRSEPDAAEPVQAKVDEAPPRAEEPAAVTTPAVTEPAVAEPAVATPAVVQPEPDAAEAVQAQAQGAPLPAVAVPATEVLDNHATDNPVASTVDGSTSEKAVDTSNVIPGSDGKIEEVAEKSPGHGIETADEKDAGSVKPADTIAFRNVEAEKQVPTSSSTGAPKPGSFGKLKTISTRRWRAPNEVDFKTIVVIPEYLSRDMEIAVKTKGEAIPEGLPAGEKVEAPTCPILVFINSKSGGRLGPELLEHLEELISPYQVYDLSKHSPSAVLQYGLGCLDRMAKSRMDECAKKTLERLRILVAGGDGTVGWVLSSVGALRELPEPVSIPPVGIIPLGTGNDLSRSFGWGGDFSSASKSALKRVLVKALGCTASTLDTWNATVMPAKSVAAGDIQFPHAMHPQHHVPLPSTVAGEKHAKDERDPAFEGLFFNYFSVGMDAQVAYGFHHLRDEKPWLARGRTANQMIYSSFGCTQGWFCTACSVAPRARGVTNVMKLWIRKRGSKDWEDIHLPSNIRAVVICNLKSYAGGRNPWGKPSSGRREKEGFEEQKCDDGLLEVMGLKDGWHSAFVLLEVSTAVRLCQAEAIKLELNGKSRKKAYLQMDGEPWMQPMGKPDDETNTVVMIEKLPQPSLLLKR